jgi:hypothetical protein
MGFHGRHWVHGGGDGVEEELQVFEVDTVGDVAQHDSGTCNIRSKPAWKARVQRHHHGLR